MRVVASARERWTNADPELQWSTGLDRYVRADDASALLDSLLDLVEAQIEGTLGRRTITATMFADDLRQDHTARLPLGPVTQIVSCIDANSVAVGFEYRCHGKDDRIFLKTHPAFPLTVTYKAGHSPIPGAMKRLVYTLAAEEYDNRSAAADGPQKPWIQRVYDLYRRGSPVG